MKFKNVSVILCLVVVGIAFCLAPVFAQEKIVLKMWDRQEAKMGDAHNYIIAEFEKLHPNVQIQRRFTDSTTHLDVVRMAFLAGNEPDLVDLQGTAIMKELAGRGQILDLTEWYAEYGDRYPESADAWTKVDGVYYGVPYGDSIGLIHLFYNKDILNKYGITAPQWWSEFMEACEKLKAQGELPIALGNKWGNTGEHMIQRLLTQTIGGEGPSGLNAIINRTEPDVGPRWTDPKAVQAAETFEELYTKGYYPKEAATIDYHPGRMMFVSGQSAFYFDGTWFVGITDFPPDFNLGFIRHPRMKDEVGGTKNGGSVAYMDSWAISSRSPYPELCLEFLELYSRSDVHSYAFYNVGKMKTMPTVVGVLEGKELTEYQTAVWEFIRTCDDNALWPADCLPPELGLKYWREGQIDITSGAIDAVGFMERMEEAHQEYLRGESEA